MARFSNLEFDDPKGGPPERLQRELGPKDEPRDERHYLALADEHHRAARFEKALRCYSRALEFNPNQKAGWLGQVRMLLELGEVSEARLWADKGLDLHRDDPELLAAKAVACARLGEADRAIAFCDLALERKGAPPFVWLARGEVLLSTGARETAEHCFGKAKAEARGDWFVSLLAARACAFHGWPSKALAWVRPVVAARPESAFAWLVQGDAQAALGLAREAERSYERALEADRELLPAKARLARLREGGLAGRLWARLRAILGRS